MKKNIYKKILLWVDSRFPLTSLWNEHLAEYYAPKNFNFWYYFGSLAILVLVIQLGTGVWLAMSYDPSSKSAFASVEYIMRDVSFGWLIRYLHSTGASFFFILVYLHMFRGLIYGSYVKPRELLWLIGMLIFLCLMAEAFFGYLLPWGNMSFWGAQVITSLFSLAGTGAGLAFDQTGGTFTGSPHYVGDEHAVVAILINQAANLIAARTRRGAGNWIVISPSALTVLQSATTSAFARTTEGTFEAPTNTKFVGTLNSSMRVCNNFF